MGKAKRYAIVLFLLVAILAVLVPSRRAKAQLVTVGVTPGESFTYGVPDGSPWVWMDPSSAPTMPQWEAFVDMSTISFNVSSNWKAYAPATQIMFNESFKYRNGTVIRWPGQTIDVSTGMGMGASWFIPPGLSAGDNIYPGNSSSLTINGTSSDQPFWPGREVCILNDTVGVPLENASSKMAVERTVFMWDRATGVLLAGFEEASSYDPTTQTGIQGAVLYELIANNAGIPMQYPKPADMTPIYIVVAIIVIVILGVVIALVATRKPKKEHKRLKSTTAKKE